MTFQESLKMSFKRAFQVSGRASRQEWVSFFALTVLVNLIINLTTNNPDLPMVVNVIAALIGLILVVPWFTVSVRRLHDTGRSGFFMLLHLIPLIGTLIVIILCIGKDNPLPNKYGEPPLGGPVNPVDGFVS